MDLVPPPVGKNTLVANGLTMSRLNLNGVLKASRLACWQKDKTRIWHGLWRDFAPATKTTIIHTHISGVVACHRPLYQMNVNNSFLSGLLIEKIYMTPLLSLPHHSRYVCKQHCALYGGHRQALVLGLNTSSTFFLTMAILRVVMTSTLFFVSTARSRVLLLYVNDMLSTNHGKKGIQSLKIFVNSKLDMEDFGPLHYFLGIEVACFPRGYLLSQKKT